MNKKILKKFITITVLALAFIFITINTKAEVTDAERNRLQDIARRIEQHAQDLEPNYQNPHRGYVLFLPQDDIFFVLGIYNRVRAGWPILIDFTIPAQGAVCTSDWHGDLPGLTGTASAARRQGKVYIITGDAVDRGKESVECAIYALIQAILYPDLFIYIAGDHEFERVNRRYGLFAEIRAKYGAEEADGIFNAFNQSFEYLPLAAVANGKGLFVHGGFGRTTDLGELRALPAPRSSWENREVSLDDERLLNLRQEQILQALRRELDLNRQYSFTDQFRDYKRDKEAALEFLKGILDPNKAILDITWSDFEKENQYGCFPTCTSRGFNIRTPYSETATNFTPNDVIRFFKEEGLEIMFRGHEHKMSECGGRQVVTEGKTVVTTTSSKSIYRFDRNSRNLLLPRGDVIHIAEDLSFSFQDTEKYVAAAKLEAQRKQGQANFDALLKQGDELFKFEEVCESEKRLAEEQEANSNYLEALKHKMLEERAALQAATLQFTALADKYGHQNRSTEFYQKANRASECAKTCMKVQKSITKLEQTNKELESIPIGVSFKKSLLVHKLKQKVKKIKRKMDKIKDFVTVENVDQLRSEGIENRMAESLAYCQTLLLRLRLP